MEDLEEQEAHHRSAAVEVMLAGSHRRQLQGVRCKHCTDGRRRVVAVVPSKLQEGTHSLVVP